MTKGTKKIIGLDDIDVVILEELRKNPRESLRTIEAFLKKRGLKATPETIRKRIKNLNKNIEFQLLPKFDVFGLDNIILLIKVRGAKKARKRVIEILHKVNGFGVAELIGSYDIIGFVAIKKGLELGKIIDSIKSLPEVEDVEYFLITKSHSAISHLLRQLKK